MSFKLKKMIIIISGFTKSPKIGTVGTYVVDHETKENYQKQKEKHNFVSSLLSFKTRWFLHFKKEGTQNIKNYFLIHCNYGYFPGMFANYQVKFL